MKISRIALTIFYLFFGFNTVYANSSIKNSNEIYEIPHSVRGVWSTNCGLAEQGNQDQSYEVFGQHFLYVYTNSPEGSGISILVKMYMTDHKLTIFEEPKTKNILKQNKKNMIVENFDRLAKGSMKLKWIYTSQQGEFNIAKYKVLTKCKNNIIFKKSYEKVSGLGMLTFNLLHNAKLEILNIQNLESKNPKTLSQQVSLPSVLHPYRLIIKCTIDNGITPVCLSGNGSGIKGEIDISDQDGERKIGDLDLMESQGIMSFRLTKHFKIFAQEGDEGEPIQLQIEIKNRVGRVLFNEKTVRSYDVIRVSHLRVVCERGRNPTLS